MIRSHQSERASNCDWPPSGLRLALRSSKYLMHILRTLLGEFGPGFRCRNRPSPWWWFLAVWRTRSTFSDASRTQSLSHYATGHALCKATPDFVDSTIAPFALSATEADTFICRGLFIVCDIMKSSVTTRVMIKISVFRINSLAPRHYNITVQRVTISRCSVC